MKMAVFKAVIILLLFEPTIISGNALEYYSPAAYQESNAYGTEWNYDTITNSVAVQYSETKKPSPDPCILSYAKKAETEYKPKQNPSYPSPPNEPCCCEICSNQRREPYDKPHYKPSGHRYRRPLYDPWGDSYCQPSLSPRIKKKKEETDPSKLLLNVLQLPITLLDGLLAKDSCPFAGNK